MAVLGCLRRPVSIQDQCVGWSYFFRDKTPPRIEAFFCRNRTRRWRTMSFTFSTHSTQNLIHPKRNSMGFFISRKNYFTGFFFSSPFSISFFGSHTLHHSLNPTTAPRFEATGAVVVIFTISPIGSFSYSDGNHGCAR